MTKMTVAIHEAGHAVACVHLGIGFSSVTCVPGLLGDQEVDGHVKLDPEPDWASRPRTKDCPEGRAYWERYLIMKLAGPAARKVPPKPPLVRLCPG